jgi:hypothetical protein
MPARSSREATCKPLSGRDEGWRQARDAGQAEERKLHLAAAVNSSTTLPITPSQSPGAVCVNNRMSGYHGVRSPVLRQRQQVS